MEQRKKWTVIISFLKVFGYFLFIKEKKVTTLPRNAFKEIRVAFLKLKVFTIIRADCFVPRNDWENSKRSLRGGTTKQFAV